MDKQDEIFPDDDIVQSVLGGNSRNFEILIDRYSRRIINFIHKMIFDYDEAQSLAQDVFIKVYEGLPNYKSQGNFQAFVFTIAKNLTFNYIKKQKRWVWFSKFSDNKTNTMDNVFQTQGTQHEDIEKKQQDEMVIEALKTLNENQRLALILKVYLDLPYNKIVEITGWSIPKIETLISRAKVSLKNEIQKKMKNKMQENDSLNVLKMRTI